MLSQKYQQEQGELETKIEMLTAQLNSTREQENGINKWVELIEQFSSSAELTAEMLNTLIEKSLSTRLQGAFSSLPSIIAIVI